MATKTQIKLRERYKKATGVEAMTKAGAQTTAYKDYLKSECTVPWMSNWNTLEKEKPFKDKNALMKRLTTLDEANKLAEKCIVGGAGKGERLKAVAKFRRDMKAEYNIANY